MTDPAFLSFFDGEFSERLRATRIPGVEAASWDRRAAWLLWQAEGRAAPVPPAPWVPPPPSLAEFMADKPALADFLKRQN